MAPAEILYRLFWIVLAFTGARTTGMALNRLLDAPIDARNPRTSKRALPAGRITAGEVKLVALLSVCLFIIALFFLRPLFLLMAPCILALLFFYTWAKRATPYCHFFLGAIEFFAPFMSFWAFTETLSLIPCILGVAIFCWIAGMDILYALQDVSFDREFGVYSFPSVYGEKRARLLSASLYGVSFIAFVFSGVLLQLSLPYWGALVIVLMAFIRQQRSAFFPAIFFSSNAIVGGALFIGSLGAFLWKG